MRSKIEICFLQRAKFSSAGTCKYTSLGRDGCLCLTMEAGNNRTCVSHNKCTAAQRRSTLREEVFLKSQLRKQAQRGPTTLSEMSCFMLPLYAIPHSEEIHTLNYVCVLKQLPCYHMKMQKRAR